MPMVDTVQIRHVARLMDHTHFDIPKKETGSRKGPYPYYGDLFERFEVDDYGVDAPTVIFMSAAGKVINADGTFRAAMEHGRCGSSAFAHILIPFDESEAEYIFACIESMTNAVDFIGGANHLQTLDELAVLRIPVPWPCKATRDGYAKRFMAAFGEYQSAHAGLVAYEREHLGADCSQEETYRELMQRLDQAISRKDVLINDFITLGFLDGYDCTSVEYECPSHLAAFSDGRAERYTKQLSEERVHAAQEQGGAVLSDSALEPVAALDAIVAHDSWGLSAEDLAWELSPLVVLRACAAPDEWEVIAASVASGWDALVAAIDAGIAALAVDSRFAFLAGFSYQTSVLSGERLASWVTSLGSIPCWELTPRVLRGVFDLASDGPAVPDAVVQLAKEFLSGNMAACAVPAVYYPCASCGSLSDSQMLCGNGSRTVYAQFADNESLLQAAFVNALATFQGDSSVEFNACAPQHQALVTDCFGDVKADIVVLDLPKTDGEWCPKPPHREDPRWVLGVPTRMRSAFAWIQHILYHLAPQGKGIVLLPNYELRTKKSVDSTLRESLVCSGHVHAVVTLPARIWGDERIPQSMLVLSEQVRESILMADMRHLDEFDDMAVFGGNPQRKICTQGLEETLHAIRFWQSGGDPSTQCGICRIVSREEAQRQGCLLDPGKYLRA